ncbi:MAG: metallophosphoesterase family protein [Devosia sp.]|nr:metallophosphoesterase family protein [Devosia sp.]
MRIAVISDIHGNGLALEAVLEHIKDQGVDMTLNLGDMVSGPMEPGRTAQLLFEADFPTISGNHERYLIGNGALDLVDRFARSELAPHHLDWFSALPGTLSVNGDILMTHGTPRDDSTPWLDGWFRGRNVTLPDEAAVTAEAEGFDFPVILCGHTHVPRSVRLRDGRLVVNPGSVGLQMFYGSPDARYAIVERRAGKWSVMQLAIPYDHEAAGRQAVRHGFPQWTEVLTTGWAGAEGLF